MYIISIQIIIFDHGGSSKCFLITNILLAPVKKTMELIVLIMMMMSQQPALKIMVAKLSIYLSEVDNYSEN